MMQRSPRVFMIYGDQVVFSVGNYLVLFTALREAGSSAATQVAVALAIYAVCSAIAQGLVADAVIVSRDRRIATRVVSRSLGVVFATSAAAMLVVGSISSMGLVATVSAGFAVGVGAAQFTLRSVLMIRHPASALLLDFGWLFLQVVGVGILVIVSNPEWWDAGIILTWSVPCFVVLVVGLRVLHGVDSHDPRLVADTGVRSLLQAGRSFALESGLSQGNGQLPVLLLSGSVAGASAVYRGAQALFGPTMLILAGLRPLVMGTKIRGPVLSFRFLMGALVGAGAMIALGFAYYAFFPDSAGRLLAGEAWGDIRDAVPLVGIDLGQAVFGAVLYMGRRSRGEPVLAARSLSVLITAAALGTVAVVGPASPTAFDFAAAVAISAPLQVLMWTVTTWRADVRFDGIEREAGSLSEPSGGVR